MPPRVDLTGTRFGHWTLLQYVRKSIWSCQCICGSIRNVQLTALKMGRSTNCGCLKHLSLRKPKLPKGEGAFRRYLRQIVAGARIRNIVWELTTDEVKFLSKNPCHYCGKPPAQVSRCQDPGDWQVDYIYNGIDRRDNNIGYIFENCLPCCKICNFMKRDLGYEDFLRHVQSILDWQKSGRIYAHSS